MLGYLYIGGNQALPTSVAGNKGDIITATNKTGLTISSGDKVFVEPVYNGYSILPVTEYSYRQFDLQGSPTINDTNKTATSFSQSKYLKIIKQFDFSQPWEFQTGFHYVNSWYGSGGTNQFLWSGDTGSEAGMNNAGFTFRAVRFDDTTKKSLLFDIIGQTSLGTDPSVLPLTSDGDYWLKVGWTSTEYYAMYSTDKTNWTHFQGFQLSPTETVSSSPYQSTTPLTQTGSFVDIGSLIWIDTMYWRGTIYLGDTQFLSNGYPVWKAYEIGIQIPKADSYMGFALGNIANNASGSVKTVLSEN